MTTKRLIVGVMKVIVSAVALVCAACGSTQASLSASTATPTSSATATAATPLPPPVSLSGTGRETTTPFTLSSGHLVFNLTGSDVCAYDIFLVDPLNRPHDWNGDNDGNHILGAGVQENLLGFLAGTYQLAVDSAPNGGHAGASCPWTFTFTPSR
jgi:hypothetical protein